MSSHAEAHGPGEAAHATVGFYWLIGGILAALTALEVAAYYMAMSSAAVAAIEIPLLLGLSVVKFALVVMYFMHLKMDSRILTGLFLAGLFLAVFMVSMLVWLYHVVPGWQKAIGAI